MQFKLFTLITFAASALAGAAEIQASLETIAEQTVKLNETVAAYPDGVIGGLINLVPITTQSFKLQKEIEKGTEVAKASEPLTFDEALNIAGYTGQLANDVDSTLKTLIAAKPKFDKFLIVSPILRGVLKKQRSATKEFSEAVVEKIPEELASIAELLIKQIDDNFAAAIAAYE
ncbi:hypothetical protein K4F52_001522 [Lecanicillium sp. MT-2017a]|nr:hypothetical protein K4F52_001522 [Lecanicillium sp. MT-2017a]